MKNNLETYPQDGSWMSAYRWKEAFKKELREWLKENEHYRPDDDFEVKRIKEILGDSDKTT